MKEPFMNPRLQADMLEATRLTRAGRLLDATALIQRTLGGKNGPSTPNSADPDLDDSHTGNGRHPLILEGEAERVAGDDTGHRPDQRAHAGSQSGAGTNRRRPTSEVQDFTKWRSARPAGQRWPSGGLKGLRLDLDGLTMPGSPATAPLPEGARFIDASYTEQAGSRHYKLYVPSGYRGEALPLVVMLHGCTQHPDDFAAGTRMNELAEQYACLVAYPAQAGNANPSRCWNWFNAADQCRDRGEPALIAGITRQVLADYAVDPSRVYVAGLSAGGAMAAIMGVTYPDLYAAVGIHSGLAHGSAHDMPSAFAVMGRGCGIRASGEAPEGGTPVPTIVFHGDRDTTVHPGNGQQIVEQWQTVMTRQGGDWQVETETIDTPGVYSHTRTRHIDPDGHAVLEHWQIHGAGHAWSGGSPAGSYTDPRGPDASAGMLRFFLSHARSGHLFR